MFEDGSWTEKGLYGGRYIDRAYIALSTVNLTAALGIEALETLSVDDRLNAALLSKQFIEDMKAGRVGLEWHDERAAIAQYKTTEFKEQWGAMRKNMRENYLVSLCSAAEHFIKMIVTEFPAPSGAVVSTAPATQEDFEILQAEIDEAYRRCLRRTKSASKTWISMCSNSSIPSSAKKDVEQMASTNAARLVDELVLLRNVLVHQAGYSSPALATQFGVEGGTRIKIEQSSVREYSLACGDFVMRLYPALR